MKKKTTIYLSDIKKVDEERVALIMELFWTTYDNSDKTISEKVGVISTVTGRIITRELDKHFKKIDERVNREHIEEERLSFSEV